MKIKSVLASLLLLQTTAAFAEIKEVLTMHEILPYVDSDTLVVFDLDNTVMEPTQTLGSDQFFSYLLKYEEGLGYEGKEASYLASEEATFVQPTSQVKSVEVYIPKLISDLQKRKISVVALTSRPFGWAKETVDQLNSIHVDFRSSDFPNQFSFGTQGENRFFQGVIFMMGDGDKGKSLTSFLDQASNKVRRVVFVDDKLHNIQSVERALDQTSYAHLSFRYGAADLHVKAFDPKLADFEWKYFQKCNVFVSDYIAKKMMLKNDNGYLWECEKSVQE